jgi:hypothetical protein
MCCRNENNVDSYVVFEYQAGCFQVSRACASLPAPTISTGQKLKGVLSVSRHGTKARILDTVLSSDLYMKTLEA